MAIPEARRVGVILIVIAVIVGTIPAFTFSTTAEETEEEVNNPTDLPDDQIFEGSTEGQVTVWERFAFPTRVDRSDAEVQAGLPALEGEELDVANDETLDSTDNGINTKTLNPTINGEINPGGVHNSSETIEITFQDGRAEGDLSNYQGNVSYLSAKITGEGGDGFPSSYTDAVDILSDIENANANASFEMLKADASLDADGEGSVSASFDPGYHLVYAAVREDGKAGFEVNSNTGNISVDGNVTIIGVDAVSVHKAQADVDAPSGNPPGSTLNFDINTTSAFDSSKDGQVTHTVAVYNKTKFENSRMEVVVNQSELGPNFNFSEDAQIEHSIENVEGVADVEDGIEINGIDLSDGRISGTVGLGAIIERLAEDLQTDEPITDPIDQGGVSDSATEDINASVTAISGNDRATSVSVETRDSFETGTYQYIVFSTLDNNATAFSTDAGTLTLGDSAPAVSLNTSSLDFGEVPADPDIDERANDAVRNETLQITNDGNEDLSTFDFDVTGANASQFEILSGSGQTIAPGESADVVVSYVPTERASASANLEFDTNAPSGSQSVSLSGTGVGPNIDTPNRIGFGDVSGTSTEQLTITNTGDRPLKISSFTGLSTGPFSFPNDDPTNAVAAGSSRTYDIELDTSNEDPGAVDDILTLSTNDTFDSSVEVTLTGTVDEALLSLSPDDTLEFGNVSRNENVTRTLVVSNDGVADMNLTDISATGTVDESLSFDTNPSPSSPETVGADDSLFVDVTFVNATSISSAEIDVTTENVNDESVDVTAGIKQPQLNTTSWSPDFGNIPNGSTVRQDFFVENVGDSGSTLVVDLTGVFGNQFSIVNSESELTIPEGEERRLILSFTPDDTTSFPSSETLSANDPSDDFTISPVGSGVETNLSSQQDNLTFSVGRNTTQRKTFTIENTGGQDISSIATDLSSPDPFTVTSAPSSLPANSDAEIEVEFDPESGGSFTDFTRRLNVSGGGESFLISVEGEALQPTPQVERDVLDIGFTGTDEDKTRSFALRNRGPTGADVTFDLSSASFTDDQNFTLGRTDTITLSPDDSEQVGVTFNRSADGTESQTLRIPTNVIPRQNVSLTVTGTALGPNVTVDDPTDRTVGFGDVAIGSKTSNETVVVSNAGGERITIGSVGLDDTTNFSIESDPTGEELVPGGTAEVKVAATPDAASDSSEDISATVEISPQANDNNGTATLDVTATRPVVSNGSVSNFGDTGLDNTATESVTFTNDGEAVLQITPQDISANQYSIVAGGSSNRLSPGESTDITVGFTPTSQGVFNSATLDVTTTDPNNQTVSLALNGTGVESNVSYSQSTIPFGQVGVGDTNSQTVDLQNTGGATVNVTDVRLEGSDTGPFTVENRDTVLNNNNLDTQSVDISVTPPRADTLNAQLVIEANNTNTADTENVTAGLGATGTAPDISVSGSFALPQTRLGADSTRELDVQNTGNAPLDVSNVALSGQSSYFDIVDSPDVIESKATESVEVEFDPAGFNQDITDSDIADAKNGVARTATLQITNNASDKDVSLSGTGKTPDLRRSTGTLQYGSVTVGSTTTQRVTLRNNATASANVTLDELETRGDSAFGIENGSTGPAVEGTTLTPGDEVEVNVSLAPQQQSGTRNAVLSVRTNDPRQDATLVVLTSSRTIVRLDTGSVIASYENLQKSGDQPRIEFARGLDADASLRGFDPDVDVDVKTESNFVLETDEVDNASNDLNIPEADSETRDVLRYFNGTINVSIKENTFRFRASKAAVNQLDQRNENQTIDESNVTLFHDDDGDGSYTTKSAELVGETRTSFIYEGTVKSFSAFAIGAETKEDDEPSSPPDDGDGDGGDGDGGAGGGGGGGAIIEGPQQTISGQISTISGGQETTVSLSGANAGDIIRVEAGTSSEGGEATVESVDIAFAESVEGADVRVSTTNRQPAGAPDPDPAQTGQTLGYVETTVEDVSDTAISQSTFTFSVSEQRLTQSDTAPENVRLYRIVDGEPTALPTQHLGNNRFEATAPGFSVFIIGTDTADISIASADLDQTSVETGETFTTSVTVRNDGGTSSDIALALEANGQALTTETVSIAAGDETSVDLSASIDQAGTYDITVNGSPVDTLEVTGPEGEVPDEGTPTATPEPGEEPGEDTPAAGETPTPETDGVFGPGFGVIVAILALLGASLLALRRKQ